MGCSPEGWREETLARSPLNSDSWMPGFGLIVACLCAPPPPPPTPVPSAKWEEFICASLSLGVTEEKWGKAHAASERQRLCLQMGPRGRGLAGKEALAEHARSAPSAGQQPHLARALPRVLGVSHVAEAAEQLLHQEQGNLLQDGLLQVGCRRRASSAATGRRQRAWKPPLRSVVSVSRLQNPERTSRAPRGPGPAGSLRHESAAPGCAPVLAPGLARDPPPAPVTCSGLLCVWLRLGSCLSLRLQFRPPAPRLSFDAPDPSDCSLDLAASPAPALGLSPTPDSSRASVSPRLAPELCRRPVRALAPAGSALGLGLAGPKR